MIKKIKSYHIIPVFCLLIYVLISLSSLINVGGEINAYTVFALVIIQIAVFLIPSFIYKRIKGPVKPSDLGLVPFRVSNVTLIVCAAVLMFCISALFGLFAGPGTVSYAEADLASLSPVSVIYLVVVFCITPAVTEEIVFRGVVYGEYRKYGIVCATLTSSVLFSLMHFSISDFFRFLICGAILALVFEVTHSLYASMLVHFIFNLMTVFLSKLINGAVNRSESLIPFIFVFTSLILLFLFFSLSRVQRQLSLDSVNIPPAENAKSPPFQTRLRSLFVSLITPAFWACIAYAAVAAVIRLKNL